MKKKFKVAAAVAALSAAAGTAAVLLGADLIFRTGAARTQPKLTRYKEESPDKMDALNRQRLEARLHLERQPMQTVSVVSHDGLRLTGHWFPAEQAQRTVILFHGWRSTWSRDFGMHAAFLHDARCNLLLVEQRCHGVSDGKYIGFGVLERYDCLRWLDYVNREHPGLPVYLFGISMGAATVLMASGFGLPGWVRGIIADCGFTSPEAIIERVMNKKYPLYRGPLAAVVADMTRMRAGYGPEDYSTLKAMAVNHTPVLFIHGSADDFVPLQMSVENYEACRAPKSLLVVDGAPHAKSYLIAPELYRQAVLDFFARWDTDLSDAGGTAE